MSNSDVCRLPVMAAYLAQTSEKAPTWLTSQTSQLQDTQPALYDFGIGFGAD